MSSKLKILSMLRVFTSKCFKKSQLARKLKTSSRKNFLEACTTSIWLTNKPYGSPSNRSTIFFWFDWKKSLIFWIFQKAKKTLISTLVDFLSIFTDFFQRFQKNFAGGQLSLDLCLIDTLMCEALTSKKKLRRKVPRFF